MTQNKIFTEIFEDATAFKDAFNASAFTGAITNNNLEILYYLLYSKHANDHIVNKDEDQWKYKVFSTIYMYGPTWEKKQEIQLTLRGLTDTEIKTGLARQINNNGTIGNSGSNTYNNLTSTDSGQDVHNHAYNPETAPTTQTTTELDFINEQQVDKFGKTNTMSGSVANANTQTNNLQTTDRVTKGVLDSYAELWEILATDVTEEFLSKFKPLFKKFILRKPIEIEEEE